MTDIVKRLREYADQLGAAYPQCDGEMLAEEAAAEIERLRDAVLRAVSTCMTEYEHNDFMSNQDNFLRRVIPNK